MEKLESSIEANVIRWAEGRMSGDALKLKGDGGRGFPDRTLLLPGSKIVFPELKRPGKGKRYEQQKRRIARLQELGFAADFCESLDDVIELFWRYYT